MVPRRLRHLEELAGPGGRRVFVARSFRSRLLGLALLTELSEDCWLLLPRCGAVHTFGMRFALDLVFLDEAGEMLALRSRVPPGRVVRVKGSRSVLEGQASCPGSMRRARWKVKGSSPDWLAASKGSRRKAQ
jgi:uncharacterized membrane protein (UPF0127 family)